MNSEIHWSCRSNIKKMTGDAKNQPGRNKLFANIGEAKFLLGGHQCKPLGRVSLGLLRRGVVMVRLVDSYESFQLFKIELCTMH